MDVLIWGQSQYKELFHIDYTQLRRTSNRYPTALLQILNLHIGIYNCIGVLNFCLANKQWQQFTTMCKKQLNQCKRQNHLSADNELNMLLLYFKNRMPLSNSANLHVFTSYKSSTLLIQLNAIIDGLHLLWERGRMISRNMLIL